MKTGPNTVEGKSISSKNATHLGLFSAGAFVRPGEKAEFQKLRTRIMAQLSPATVMEETHATEILNATWRLLRCANLEAEFAETDEDTDPMANPSTAPTQQAIDRARAHAGNTIRRSTAELRRLQTERLLQAELGATQGLASHKDAAGTLVSEARRALLMRKLDGLHTLESLLIASEQPELLQNEFNQPTENKPPDENPSLAPTAPLPANPRPRAPGAPNYPPTPSTWYHGFA